MLDFTSALYLGIRQGSQDLGPFAALTTGVPAALYEPPLARSVARQLAAEVGVERALVVRSTLHGFLDLFTCFPDEPRLILFDVGSYPIARWGAERAMVRGARLVSFRHHAPAALAAALRRWSSGAGRPWIVVDGFCTGCGRLAPLADYRALAQRFGGRLVVDDTQALGVLGAGLGAQAPYGYGGGGSLRATGSVGGEVLLVASLAKAWGAPLAVIGGDGATVQAVASASPTRVHASPPTLADLRAAAHALAVNRASGEHRRVTLLSLVSRLRRGLRRLGLVLAPTLFPLQSVRAAPGMALPALYRRLQRLGLATVLRRPACAGAVDLAFVLTAAHRPSHIDAAISMVAAALTGTRGRVPARSQTTGRVAP